MARKRFDSHTAAELYNAGAIDIEIAEACGVSRQTICNWRNRNGLTAHGRRMQREDVPHSPPPPPPKPRRKKLPRNCLTCADKQCRGRWRAVTWAGCPEWRQEK